MLGRENGAKTCIRTTERAIADWLPFNSRRNHSYIANTILFGYNTLRGALLCRFWKISHARSRERGQNVPTHNNDAYNEYCKGSNFQRNHSYIAMLYFSDTDRLEEHFYIGFEKYLMLGRENGAKTCLRTTTTRIMNTLRALTFKETIVI